MDKKRMDQLHKACLSWGQWKTGGGDRVGIQAAWPEIPTRESLQNPVWARVRPVHAVKHRKHILPPHQPSSSRQRPQSRPLTGRVNDEFWQIDRIAVMMPLQVKQIIDFLYFRAMPFRRVSEVTGYESKKIGKLKSRFLYGIDPIVR